MAWNPSPKVAAARDFADKFKKQQVIIIALDLEANTLEATTYGETKQLCTATKRLGDAAYDAVMDALR